MKIEPGYEELAGVFREALDQAQYGKGKKRHANDKPFLAQPMMEIGRMTGPGGTIFQAMKKSQESLGLSDLPAIMELHGAINYLAGTILLLKERLGKRRLVDDLAEQDGVKVLTEGSDGEPERCCLHHGRGCT